MSWRRPQGTAPACRTQSLPNQDVHEPVSHQHDQPGRLGAVREDRRRFRGALARAIEVLHTRCPAAKPRRPREPGPHLWTEPQTRPKGSRQLRLAKAWIDQRGCGWREQQRRVSRPAQRARDHAVRRSSEALELRAGTGQGVERCIRLAPQPLAKCMSRNSCPKVPRRFAVSRQHDPAHVAAAFAGSPRPRTLNASQPSRRAGSNTTKTSCTSWPVRLPLGFPSGVHAKR